VRLGPNALRLGMVIAVVGGFPVVLSLLLSEIGGDAQSSRAPGISEFLAPGLGGVSSGGGTSIDYEPISLEQAHSLIDSKQVHRIAIRPERNVDEFWLELYEGFETPAPRFGPSRRWRVTGLEVFVFTESMPHGVPILSAGMKEVGITSDQFDDLIERIKQHNRTESSPIELLDQRGGSDSLTIPQ
jgi:hypothetical protein